MVKACKIGVVVASVILLAACNKSGERGAVVAADSLPAFVEPQDDKYLIKQGKVSMEIDPAIGGRIASVKHGNREMLITSRPTSSTLWGSVLWSSPQSDWSWPPIDVLDNEPYGVSVLNNRLVLTSGVDKKTGYQFVKSYGVNSTRNDVVVINYAIYNRSDVAKAVAPWELTRVPTSGIIFFPTGEKKLESGIFYPMELQKIGEISWFVYDEKKIRDDHHKMMTDGKEGWIAYVDRGYMLLKEFDDVPVELIASNEGEIELFTDAKKTYLEIQQQGPVVMLQPGEHLEWEVLWHIKKLPADVSVAVGSEDLVNYARDLVKN